LFGVGAWIFPAITVSPEVLIRFGGFAAELVGFCFFNPAGGVVPGSVASVTV
jgi:hypothetical protein